MIFNRLVIICAVYWNCFRLLSASDTPAAAALEQGTRFSVSPVNITPPDVYCHVSEVSR